MKPGTILNGKYRVEKELGRGGMSSVYLCTNIELGNLWALKYIHKQESLKSTLLAEEEILKKLNHISLPKIIDVFYGQSGTYIVESYIEGTPLNEKLRMQGRFDEDTVIEWAKQLSDVLIYLHNMEPNPIIYRDMKPSNIIITRDNKAVIIDFGISREFNGLNTKDTFIAGTCSYAAPEQLTTEGYTDQRTDIYSLGATLYHLLTGSLPEYNPKSIRYYSPDISRELDHIVLKCLRKNLEDRYQNAGELRADLENIRDLKLINKRDVLVKRLLLAGVIALSLTSYSVSFLGLHYIYKEKTALLDISPKVLVLSEQQIGRIIVKKTYKNGAEVAVRSDEISWKSSDQNIARVEEGKVVAMNAGKIKITGSFRDKIVQLDVIVNSEQGSFVNINLKYNRDYYVQTYAGNRNRDIKDGPLKEAEFMEPTSMTITSDGTLYVIDGNVRRIRGDRIETLQIDPEYIEPRIIRSNRKDEVFIASSEWITGDEECRIGIFKLLSENKLQAVYQNDGETFSFKDFAFDSSGRIYVLEDNLISGLARLTVIESEGKTAEVLKDDLEGIDSIAVTDDREVFLSCARYGIIYKWDQTKKDVGYFAGVHSQKHFIDGKNNRFFEPSRLYAHQNSLYVLDQGTIRKLTLLQGEVLDVETIAGRVEAGEHDSLEGPGIDLMLGTDCRRELVIDSRGDIYLTDTDNNIIRKIYIKDPHVPQQHNA